MRILYALLFLALFSCKGNDAYILNPSVGKINKILIVTKTTDWDGNIGKSMRNTFGELQVGLPQPEPILSVSQLDPRGFGSMMKYHRNVLFVTKAEKEAFVVKRDVYARPQTIIYLQGTDEQSILNMFEKHKSDIVKTFLASDVRYVQGLFEKERLDDSKYKTLENLGLSLTIHDKFKTVDDTGEFLWLRQHLLSGIAKTGSNNILVYSLPLMAESKIAESISRTRDSIGKVYIPGSREGMYMITEEAYTPYTFDTEIAGKKAFETRGKWEVKNDFMAGPFLNYTIVDKEKNRLIVFEGFTYAPSINKRAFLFELEAIGRSLKFK